MAPDMSGVMQCPTCGMLIPVDQPLLDREHHRQLALLQQEIDRLLGILGTIRNAALTAAAQRIGTRMADYAERQEAAETRGQRAHYRVRALETLSIVQELIRMAKGE